MSDLAQQMRVCAQYYDRGWWRGFWFGAFWVTVGHIAVAVFRFAMTAWSLG